MSGLREVLVALGRQSPSGPPPSVKHAVMAEFRRARRRRAAARWMVLAAAAALLLALFVARRPKSSQVVHTAQPPVEKILPKAPAIVAPVETAVRNPVRRRRVVKPSPPPQVDETPAKETPEVATDFFAIPYTEPLRPDERADVFRIEMPRANVAAFGLPISGGHLDAPVTADVLVGEDGVLRAIRFVR